MVTLLYGIAEEGLEVRLGFAAFKEELEPFDHVTYHQVLKAIYHQQDDLVQMPGRLITFNEKDISDMADFPDSKESWRRGYIEVPSGYRVSEERIRWYHSLIVALNQHREPGSRALNAELLPIFQELQKDLVTWDAAPEFSYKVHRQSHWNPTRITGIKHFLIEYTQGEADRWQKDRHYTVYTPSIP
jgi:hypothetical protein